MTHKGQMLLLLVVIGLNGATNITSTSYSTPLQSGSKVTLLPESSSSTSTVIAQTNQPTETTTNVYIDTTKTSYSTQASPSSTESLSYSNSSTANQSITLDTEYSKVEEGNSMLSQNESVVSCSETCFCEENESYASCMGSGEDKVPHLPETLRRLELRNYNLTSVIDIPIEGKVLKELQLQQCNVTCLKDDVFSSLMALSHLDLAHNHLCQAKSESFRGLPLLKYLDLSFNSIEKLNHPFQYLEQLENLNLRHNKLNKLSADSFKGLERVQYLNLDNNKIQTIDVAAFQHLGNLAHLILSNNLLSNLTRLNFFGSRLQYIDVSSIGIHRVPEALTQFVRDLRLANNRIHEIHRGDFDSYPYIGLLVLDNNGLELLEEDALGRHEYLARLWLNENRLRTIPQSLPTSLRELHIEGNAITHLRQDDFMGLHRLEQIFLKRNKISSISAISLADLVGLKSLDLQSNEIQSIGELVFAKLNALEQLDLSQNPIKSLASKVFVGLRNLRILQLSRIHTNITLVSDAFTPLISLETLDMYASAELAKSVLRERRTLETLRGLRELNLMHNELSSVRTDFASFFPNMSLIKLSGNSWDCSDESILWMKNWTRFSSVSFYRYFSVRCGKPAELNLHPVLLLDYSNFSHSTQSPSSIRTTTTAATTQITSTVEQKRVLAKPYLHKGIFVATNASQIHNVTLVFLKGSYSSSYTSTPSTRRSQAFHKPVPTEITTETVRVKEFSYVVRARDNNKTGLFRGDSRQPWTHKSDPAKGNGWTEISLCNIFLIVMLVVFGVWAFSLLGFMACSELRRWWRSHKGSDQECLITTQQDSITDPRRGLNNRLYYLLQKSSKCTATNVSDLASDEAHNELFSVSSLTERKSH